MLTSAPVMKKATVPSAWLKLVFQTSGAIRSCRLPPPAEGPAGPAVREQGERGRHGEPCDHVMVLLPGRRGGQRRGGGGVAAEHDRAEVDVGGVRADDEGFDESLRVRKVGVPDVGTHLEGQLS